MNDAVEVMNAIRRAAEEAFEQHLDRLAVWTEKRWNKIQIVVEITREIAAHMLSSMNDVAMQHGVEIQLETFAESASDRIIVKAVLTLRYNNLEQKRTGIGEAIYEKRYKNEEGGIDNNAARAAETRAIKRALELFVPSVATKLVKISEWLTAWAAKNPPRTNEHYDDYAKRALQALVQLKKQKQQ